MNNMNPNPTGPSPLHSHCYTRKQFLKGICLSAAGAALLDPLLGKLHAEVEGQAQATRFLFVLEGNGCPPEQVHPGNLKFVPRGERKQTTEEKIDAEQLPRALQPVKDYVDRMLILQGASGRVCGGGHSTYYGALGCFNTREGKHVLGPTLDYLLGQANSTLFKNIVLGISSRASLDMVFNSSSSGAGSPIATICNPVTAYKRMFAAIGDRESVAIKGHLLDYVTDDIKAVQKRLGSTEKEKLEKYLSAYEKIGHRHAEIGRMDGAIRDRVAPLTDKYQSRNPVDRLDCHFEMATSALVSGLTNVATIASGVGHQDFSIVFDKLGVSFEKHTIGHALYEKEPMAIEASQKIRAFHFEMIARTMKQLQSIPEGEGTMLDNTVIVYLSDAANEHHSTCAEWPYVILGGNPKLKLDGRYVTYADIDNRGHKTVNTIHNTLLHAAGRPTDDFGQILPGLDEGVQEGSLGEMLA
ncbi:MAG: hypothetical protein ACI8XO_002377 [Verrucomicrobiales bacterium]|jgi:hypothetical protein